MARAEAKYRITAEDRTRNATQNAKKNFKALDGVFTGVKASALGAVAGIASVGMAVRDAAAAATNFDQLAKSAKQLGLTVDQLDAWNHVAALGGSSADGLAQGLKGLSKYMHDAAMGTGEARVAFEQLGLDVTDSNGVLKDTPTFLLEIADKLKGVKSGTEKTALAQRMLGESGVKLIPVLDQGADAIKEQLVQAQVLGVRYADMTGKGEALVDAQTELSRSWRNVKDIIYSETMPGLATLTSWLAINLTNAITGVDEDWRRMVAGLRFGASEDSIQDLQAMLSRTKREYDEVREAAVGAMDPMADMYIQTMSTPNEKQMDSLKKQIEYLEQQIKLEQQELEMRQRIQGQLDRERKAAGAGGQDIAGGALLPPTMPDPASAQEMVDAYRAFYGDIGENLAALDFEMPDPLGGAKDSLLTFEDMWNSTWPNLMRGPEAIGQALMNLAWDVSGKALKAAIVGEEGKTAAALKGVAARSGIMAKEAAMGAKSVGVSIWEGAAKIWKAYAGIPFAGQALSLAGIAAMVAGIGKLKPRAEGGLFDAGERMLVGERGPEVIQMRGAGEVVPNHQLQPAAAATFSPTFVIQGSLVNDGPSMRNFARDIGQALRDAGFDI